MRRAAGLSQRRVAAEIGIAHSTLSRIEAGRATATSLTVYAQLFAVLGGRLNCKVYPEGDPLRDEAQLRLIARLRALLHAAIRARTEVPLPISGDMRAWDMLLAAGGTTVGVEAETVLEDLQELEREIALKARDGGVEVVLLLVADTARNRRILRANRETLRARFPLDTRAALAELRAGRLPSAGAIIIL